MGQETGQSAGGNYQSERSPVDLIDQGSSGQTYQIRFIHLVGSISGRFFSCLFIFIYFYIFFPVFPVFLLSSFFILHLFFLPHLQIHPKTQSGSSGPGSPSDPPLDSSPFIRLLIGRGMSWGGQPVCEHSYWSGRKVSLPLHQSEWIQKPCQHAWNCQPQALVVDQVAEPSMELFSRCPVTWRKDTIDIRQSTSSGDRKRSRSCDLNHPADTPSLRSCDPVG